MLLGNPTRLSLIPRQNLSRSAVAISRALERMASGKRINSARDDIAGYSIAQGLTSQINAFRQNIRGVNNALGLLQTADSAMAAQTEILIRMKELAIQSTNGATTDVEREALQSQLADLLGDFDRLNSTTTFQGQRILDGSIQNKGIQVGNQQGQTIRFSVSNTSAETLFSSSTSGDAEGTGSFSFRASYGTSADPRAFLQVDLNGDGALDLAWITKNGDQLQRAYNDSLGDFTVSSTNVGPSPNSLASGDVDGDGDQDYVVAKAADEIRVYKNTGSGGASLFTTITSLISSPTDAQLADLDGDGALDLVTGSGSSSVVQVFMGNGDGTFTTGTTFSTIGSVYQLRLEDIDGDSFKDIVFATQSNFRVYLNNGDGTFSNTLTSSSTGEDNYGIEVGDFNGDGKLDVITAAHTSDRITFFFGDGAGSFTSSQTTVTTPSGLKAFDYNGDGHLDFAAATSSSVLSIYVNNGDGTFTMATSFSSLSDSSNRMIEIGDFTGDGVQDIAVMANARDAFGLYEQSTITPEESTSIEDLDISTQESATDSLALIEDALDRILAARSDVAAYISRIHSIDRLSATTLLNLEEARSYTEDADLPLEISNLVAAQMVEDASLAMLSQANLQFSLVQQLLIDLDE